MGKAFALEPLIILGSGGTALVVAGIQLWNAFAPHPLSATQQTAIMGLFGVLIPIIQRMLVTPIATLPPGVPQQIADHKAAEAMKP